LFGYIAKPSIIAREEIKIKRKEKEKRKRIRERKKKANCKENRLSISDSQHRIPLSKRTTRNPYHFSCLTSR